MRLVEPGFNTGRERFLHGSRPIIVHEAVRLASRPQGIGHDCAFDPLARNHASHAIAEGVESVVSFTRKRTGQFVHAAGEGSLRVISFAPSREAAVTPIPATP